jgi:hypothetical protein
MYNKEYRIWNKEDDRGRKRKHAGDSGGDDGEDGGGDGVVPGNAEENRQPIHRHLLSALRPDPHAPHCAIPTRSYIQQIQ